MPRHLVCLVLVFGLFVCSQAHPAGRPTDVVSFMPPPQSQIKSHTEGNMKLVISNWGIFGNSGDQTKYVWSCEFPANSGQDYLFQGAVWIGGVVGGDTLVSVGADGWLFENELFPGSSPWDTIMERSCDTLSPHYSPEAISEQDFIAAYTDTVGPPYAPPDHRPMGIKVTQHTYSWTHDYLRDFILIRYWIENIRADLETIREVYVGLYVDADVTPVTTDYTCTWWSGQDDITGFRVWKDESDTLWPSATKLYRWDGTQYVETDVGGTPKYQSPSDYITVAWVADNDGFHSSQHCPNMGTATSVAGSRVVFPPPEEISYNWWLSDPDLSLDWGPYHPEDPSDIEGTPMGDSSKYRIMSNGYFDPDQVCSDLEYPPGVDSINDTRYLLSFGPYDLPAGDTLTLVFAKVGGENFHDGGPWCEWGFEDLALNASWAYVVYDNPGVDTDSNGYAGDFIIVHGETLYVSGDGVPDFKVPEGLPLPVPKNLRITSFDDSCLNIMWESAYMKEFGGYKLYRSADGNRYDPITGVLRDTFYSDSSGLEVGIWYHYRVTALDTFLAESGPSNTDSALFGRPHPPANLIVGTGTNGYLDLTWEPPGDPDLDGYSIYRKAEDDTSVYAKIDSGVAGLAYRDTTVTNGILYWYQVTAVDSTGLESEPTNGARGLPMGLDSGILLVDATRNLTGAPGLPTDEQVDEFYHRIVEGYQYTDFENSSELCSLTLQDLSPYSTLIWHSDDVLIPRAPPEEVLRYYMETGGNVWLVGYQLLGRLSRDFLNTYAGVDSFRTNDQIDFVGAVGLLGYPSLEVDTNKVFFVWQDAIPNVSVCYLDTSSQSIYGYDSKTDSPPFEGNPCAFARLGGDYNFIGFWFPLYPMREDSAVEAGRQVIEDLGEVPPGVEERFARPRAWRFELRQNFPNPFSNFTRIAFTIPAKGHVKLDVYDVCGRLVNRIMDEEAGPGRYESDWDGLDSKGNRVANGVYFYRLNAGEKVSTRKMVLLK